MAAKLKLASPFTAQSMAALRDKARGVFKAIAAPFAKPFVGPALAFGLLGTLLVVFFSVSADPEASSPSVRIKLMREKAAHAETQVATAQVVDNQGFAMDATGIFGDAAVEDGAQGATITLPGAMGPQIEALQKSSEPLAKAPFAGMVQTTNAGPLPVITPAGLAPASAYARPYTANGKPKVALIIGGLGLNAKATRDAIEKLPPEVTLSFVPYATGLQGWIDLARQYGHEVMIEVPMQPQNYPVNDPGPQTLLVGAKSDQLQARIDWALSRAVGYFGVINYQGGAFFKDQKGTAQFTDTLRLRGVAFIDDGTAKDVKGGWSRASVDLVVDNLLTQTAIGNQFSSLEKAAQNKGQALGNGFAYPVTLSAAQKWAEGLDGRGFQLVPASAILH